METAWNSVKFMVALMLGVAGGVTTDTVLSGTSHVPLGVSVSVVVTAVGISIAISKMIQKLQDSVDDLHKSVEDLKRRMTAEEAKTDVGKKVQ
jgi:hypothetical protein